MQQKPQRPFVPHRTPKSSTGVSTSSEFRLSPPFIPGAERSQALVEVSAGSAEATPGDIDREAALRGIEEYVQDEYVQDEYELPPIEHFTDPLPRVEDFAPANEGAMIEGSDAMDYTSVGTAPPVPGSSGWVEEDWQRFDWRAAAALGDAPDAEATNDWASTDWEAPAPLPRVRLPSAAQAIANALDTIARQIRDGDLAPPGPGELGDPTAIAAKLAALLGVRS